MRAARSASGQADMILRRASPRLRRRRVQKTARAIISTSSGDSITRRIISLGWSALRRLCDAVPCRRRSSASSRAATRAYNSRWTVGCKVSELFE